jgi:hypothetical protein
MVETFKILKLEKFSVHLGGINRDHLKFGFHVDIERSINIVEEVSEERRKQYDEYRRLPLDGDFHAIMSQYPSYTNTPRAIATIETMQYWHKQIEE